jgi:SAM-dependent methyltransferase
MPVGPWRKAYDERIERVYQSMLPVLPAACESLLDIGGGLSGIGARICEHYGYETLVAVLDGKNTLAVVDKHREPFNNATQTSRFLRANGVRRHEFFAPDEEIDRTFDLIISTQAWCFHIAPEVYLEKVKKALRPNGTLIVDVRKNHPEWRDELRDAFGSATLLAEADKWERIAFEVKHAD